MAHGKIRNIKYCHFSSNWVTEGQLWNCLICTDICIYIRIQVCTGCLKNVANKMLLKPRCTRSIRSSRHPQLLVILARLGPEFFVWSFFTIDYTGWSAFKSCPWENLAPQNWILFRIFGIQQHSVSIFFWDTRIAKDCLFTGQEQACTRITWLFVCLVGCHHAKNGPIHRTAP